MRAFLYFKLGKLGYFHEIAHKLAGAARAYCVPFRNGLPIAKRGRFATPS